MKHLASGPVPVEDQPVLCVISFPHLLLICSLSWEATIITFSELMTAASVSETA
jgi:hypothetical protein